MHHVVGETYPCIHLDNHPHHESDVEDDGDSVEEDDDNDGDQS